MRILAVSADCRQERVTKMLSLGAEAVLNKPLSQKTLIEAYLFQSANEGVEDVASMA